MCREQKEGVTLEAEGNGVKGGFCGCHCDLLTLRFSKECHSCLQVDILKISFKKHALRKLKGLKKGLRGFKVVFKGALELPGVKLGLRFDQLCSKITALPAAAPCV